MPAKSKVFHGSWSFPITLANVTDADVVTDFVPGFPGRIVRTYFVLSQAVVSTGSKATTLNLEINAVNLVGGVVSLTSALLTPIGAVVAGTAITGSNNFDGDDTISVEATSTTAFAEGAGALVVEYEGKVL